MSDKSNDEQEKKKPFDRYKADNPNFGRMTFKAKIGKRFEPEFYAYPPGTVIEKDGFTVRYGELTDDMRASIFKEVVVLLSFLTEDERKVVLERSDLDKPVKPHELENWIIRALALDGWADKEITQYICQKVGHIEQETVKKRRQRMFAKLRDK